METDDLALKPDSTTTVFVARMVRTLDPERPTAQAFAVKGEKIIAVGSRRGVTEFAPQARVVDLGSAVVVPGLADAHGHLHWFGKSLTVVKLRGAKSLAEIIGRLKAAGPTSYQGDWLIGGGWDQNEWTAHERKFPNRATLDAAFPTTPVMLTRVDEHAAWLNSEALRRVGITRATKNPGGGRIERDAKGEPTGILIDNAISLVNGKLPPVTFEQLEARLDLAIRTCVSLGLTSVHDAGMDFETFHLLQQWDMAGRLPIRVYAMARGNDVDTQVYLDRGTFHGRMLTMKAVKFFLDGSLGSRGAALHKPYADDPKQSGLFLLEREKLEERAKAFMERGFQVAIHAIGDKANTVALDVLEKLQAETNTQSLRHRVEHAQIVRPQDLERFGKLGIIASMQPTHATSDMGWAQERLGAERLKGAYAWKTLLSSGAHLAFGSDFPVEAPAPLAGIYAARTRQDARGQPDGGWLPDEKLTGLEALQAFTREAAYAAHAEEHRGTFSVGRAADFVALSVDPVEGEPSQLLSAHVLLTVVAGRESFRRQGDGVVSSAR